jgi:Ca2+-binding EF-hand superfamily protein
MRGAPFIVLAVVLLVAACAAPKKPHWTPFEQPRSEEWHSGRMLILSYDVDHDSKITREELEAGLRQYFKQADTNHDGKLDPDEVAAANQRRIALDGTAAIPLIDWNHDGYVDFNEFASGVRSEFEQLDLDGDGVVTLDELKRAPP